MLHAFDGVTTWPQAFEELWYIDDPDINWVSVHPTFMFSSLLVRR